eukprot:TRINITY_DN1978_c0_g1_i5.p1 TRINITY_DN1978_c0_g1~~TRINITY_DN1978_c0_g1_i5.p1  ORF type:complete len:507 (-),score=82.22 TRINITY_DN1978_c0_g1_i5:175-1695(-)
MSARQQKIRQAMVHAWKGYSQHCWGHDELVFLEVPPDSMASSHPLSTSRLPHTNLTATCDDWMHMGLTIVDALDTLALMELQPQLRHATQWITTQLHFDIDHRVSVFEVTIRILGGLLAAFDRSRDCVFLLKAKQLAHALLPAFDSWTGLPYTFINLKHGEAYNDGFFSSITGGLSRLADIGSLQLEFVYLSHVLGDSLYETKSMKVYEYLDSLTSSSPLPGLFPVFISPTTGSFSKSDITLGALGDSFYEYLLKVWILTGKNNDRLKKMYNRAMQAMITHLIHRAEPGGQVYVAEYSEDGHINHHMHHLACFVPGMLALGSRSGIVEPDTARLHLALAEELAETCYSMYSSTASHVSVETVRFSKVFYNISDAIHRDLTAPAFALRPETVESLFILHRLTGKPKYRQYAWRIFQAIQQHAQVAGGGYSELENVDSEHPRQHGRLHSYFFAETLKYLYLLFSDNNVFNLDRYVFTTEAHPLSILSHIRTDPSIFYCRKKISEQERH